MDFKVYYVSIVVPLILKPLGFEKGFYMRGLIAVVAALLVIGAVIFSGSASRGTTVANPAAAPVSLDQGSPIPNAGGTPVFPVKIVLECEEHATLVNNEKAGKPLLTTVTATEGKTITFLQVPEEIIKKCGLEKEKESIAALPARASYVFEAPRDDVYYVNLRAKWSDTCGNSVWVRMNGSENSEFLNLEDENGKKSDKNYKWDWHQVMVGGQPKGFKLAKGQHTLWMNVREDGVQLDQWVITTEASRQTGEAAKKSASGS